MARGGGGMGNGGGNSRQKRVARRVQDRMADDLVEKVAQRLGEAKSGVAEQPAMDRDTDTFRTKLSAFWGSTPVWAAIGVLGGALGSQISLRLMYVGMWMLTVFEFMRVGFFERRL